MSSDTPSAAAGDPLRATCHRANQTCDDAAICRATESALVAKAKQLRATADGTSWELADTYAELRVLGWTVRRIACACETNPTTVQHFSKCVERFPRETERPPFWEAYQEVRPDKAKIIWVARNTGEMEWYTPAEYVEAARHVLGEIDLDPASSDIAQRTVKSKTHYTAKEDGLQQSWTGRVWLNPPYSVELIGRFVAKLCEHHAAGDVPEALLLVNNATETEWFQLAARCASVVCFPNGRIKFLDESGNRGAPLQGQAVLYFGPDPDGFCKRFADFGFCVKVVRA